MNIPVVPYLEMGGYNGFLFRNRRFQHNLFKGSLFKFFWSPITQGIKPVLAVDRAVELSLHYFNRLAIHL